jgi:hypothetical protein
MTTLSLVLPVEFEHWLESGVDAENDDWEGWWDHFQSRYPGVELVECSSASFFTDEHNFEAFDYAMEGESLLCKRFVFNRAKAIKRRPIPPLTKLPLP